MLPASAMRGPFAHSPFPSDSRLAPRSWIQYLGVRLNTHRIRAAAKRTPLPLLRSSVAEPGHLSVLPKEADGKGASLNGFEELKARVPLP